MTNQFTAEQKTFWIAHNESNIEQGTLEPGQNISTGLSNFETYADPREWNRRLVLLKKDYDRAVDEWKETQRLEDPIQKLAHHRWLKETGIVECSGGVILYTDRESRSQMTATIVSLKEGLIAEPVPWKAKNGWFLMSFENLLTASRMVAFHVAICFMSEKIVQEQFLQNPNIDVVESFETMYQYLFSLPPVNINTASIEVLAASLLGIGPALASKIIEGRPWTSANDLSQINGISDSMIANWKSIPGILT